MNSGNTFLKWEKVNYEMPLKNRGFFYVFFSVVTLLCIFLFAKQEKMQAKKERRLL